jgi:hypothetical protein
MVAIFERALLSDCACTQLSAAFVARTKLAIAADFKLGGIELQRLVFRIVLEMLVHPIQTNLRRNRERAVFRQSRDIEQQARKIVRMQIQSAR